MNNLKQLAVMLLLGFTAVSCSETVKNENPLLTEFNTPFGTPPFDQIKPEHYVPAIDSAISEARKEVDAIVANQDAPAFQNTIEALDRSGKQLGVITNILFNLNSAETDTTLQKIVREVSPKLTDFGNDINLNPELFLRVKAVYDVKDSLNLTVEQTTLLEKTYRGFVSSGANLDEAGKEKFRAISRELSDLSLQYDENLLAETNGYTLNITDSAKLSGLPAGFVEALAMAAKEQGKEGWVVTLHAPLYIPFMKYADDRDLRRELFVAYNSRCFKGDQYDNQKVLKRIVELRLEMAKLLGFETYADIVLEDRMAEKYEKVNQFLTDLLAASVPAAKAEVAEVEEFAKTLGFSGKLERWDWSYYSEKLKNSKYSFNEEELKPYFQLEKVRDGIFMLANKLYGLSFQPNTNIPVYHSDVTAYEVYDESGRFLSVLYLDFFPRAGKSGGAWMTSFRSQYRNEKGEDVRPFISVVCNFTKPTESAPSLLTFDEVTTFLHEFGHALHGMLSDVTYSSLSGTSVYRDFVELPSQIMENWAVEKEFLDLFASHYQTGEKLPAELIQKIIDSQNYLAGYMSVRQLSFGIIDMAWHTLKAPYTGDVNAFERKAMAATETFPEVKGTNFSTAFSHIFAGGYAAGYYSYKWAEVLDADAYSVFKERGIFNKEVAKSFRENVLSKGGSEHPMVLYKRFRGQEPTVDALLVRSGLK